MERRKPAAIDRATALRYMGASGWTPDAATAALLDKAEQTVLTAAAPRAVYRRLPRTALPLENCGSDLTPSAGLRRGPSAGSDPRGRGGQAFAPHGTD